MQPPNFAHLNGFKLVESIVLTVPGEPVEVPRTWRERLFTFKPWRPLQATRWQATSKPDPAYYILKSENKIVAHPETMRRLIKEVERLDRQGALSPRAGL